MDEVVGAVGAVGVEEVGGVEEEAIPCCCRAEATKGGDRTGCVLLVAVATNEGEEAVVAEERVVVVGDVRLLLRVCCNIWASCIIRS